MREGGGREGGGGGQIYEVGRVHARRMKEEQKEKVDTSICGG